MGRSAPKPSPAAGTSDDYEAQRAARIAANKQRLQELGIVEEVKALADDARKEREAAAAKKVPNPARKSRKEYQEFLAACPIRRSARNVDKEVNYSLDDADELKDRLPRKRKVNLLGTTGDIIMLAEEKRVRMEGVDGVEKGGWDSGRGVRWQGGRIYDSKYGVTCHWCRQKTLEDHVTCTNANCGNGKRMAVSFCKMCLRNRHGEDVVRAEASGIWWCPTCRGSCGEGCKMCCNCGPCRKKAGLAPTHQIVKEARTMGFDNVHDYMVWQSTGKDADAIADYKRAHAWGRWIYEDIVRPVQEEEGPAEDEEGPADTQANKENAGEQATPQEAPRSARGKAKKATTKGAKGTKGKKAASGSQDAAAATAAAASTGAPASTGKAAATTTTKGVKGKGGSASKGGSGTRGTKTAVPAGEQVDVSEAAIPAAKVPLQEAGGKPMSRKERMMARLGLAA